MAKTSHIDVSERKLLLRVVDILVIISSLFLANTFFYQSYVIFSSAEIVTWLSTLIVYYLFFAEVFQAYDLNVSNNSFLTIRSIMVTTFLVTIFYIFTPIITPSLPENRIQIAYFYLLLTVPILLWRFLYMWIIFSPRYFKYLIVIGHSTKVPRLLGLVKRVGHHHVQYYVSDKEVDGGEDNFKEIITSNISELVDNNNITEVLVSSDGFSESLKEQLNKKMIQLFEEGINIKSFEKYYEEVTERVPREYLNSDFYKTLNFSKNNDNNLYLFFHRGLDIIVGLIGIITLTLVIPFVFIGNLFGSRGSLFYTQKRVGKKGKPFSIYKFRTMVTNAEKDGAVWAQKNDSRITPFGKFLRNTRIDEIPQFYNILKGDMSLIGPRPERPEFVSDLEKKIPFYAIRHVVRPGLTGWAQVNYPYASSIEDQEVKLRYDLYYIKERSLFIDFKILIKTITTVLFFRGQ